MKAAAVALVLSLSLLGAERASAADLPLPGGAPIPPSSYYPISPPVNWGGVYIGLNGGYGVGRSDWTNSFGTTGTFPTSGPLLGATLGINYAGFGDWVLLGFEGIALLATAFNAAALNIDGRDGRALACEQFDARAPHAGGRRRDHRQFVF
jgi:outer membrane immunogenic protein